MDIKSNELLGLLLQGSFKAPSGVDSKTFKFLVEKNHYQAKAPPFSNVTIVIQSASNKSKNK